MIEWKRKTEKERYIKLRRSLDREKFDVKGSCLICHVLGGSRVFSSVSYGLLTLHRCVLLTNNIVRTQNSKQLLHVFSIRN